MRKLVVLVMCALVALGEALPAEGRHRQRRERRPRRERARDPQPQPQPSDDALVRRVRGELAVFTGWLRSHGASGYAGEVGWPSGDARWNALAERWFADADAAGLPVTVWATGEWWGTGYPLSAYVDSDARGGVDTPRAQAQVLEAHRAGVNIAGGEFGAPVLDPTSSFSNTNPGTYDRDYHYDTQATFDFLASRGVRLVRLPFRWERVQRSAYAQLDPAELGRLRDAVRRAGAAGMSIVLDMHNYGGYVLSGRRVAIGSPELPAEAFANVWGQLAPAFASEAAIAGYGLMNEPVAMPGGAATWERASALAVSAIRSAGERRTVFVGGYEWSGAQRWTSVHARPWVSDADVRYEAHHYFDRDNSGAYVRGYDEEVADAASRGF